MSYEISKRTSIIKNAYGKNSEHVILTAKRLDTTDNVFRDETVVNKGGDGGSVTIHTLGYLCKKDNRDVKVVSVTTMIQPPNVTGIVIPEVNNISDVIDKYDIDTGLLLTHSEYINFICISETCYTYSPINEYDRTPYTIIIIPKDGKPTRYDRVINNRFDGASSAHVLEVKYVDVDNSKNILRVEYYKDDKFGEPISVFTPIDNGFRETRVTRNSFNKITSIEKKLHLFNKYDTIMESSIEMKYNKHRDIKYVKETSYSDGKIVSENEQYILFNKSHVENGRTIICKTYDNNGKVIYTNQGVINNTYDKDGRLVEIIDTFSNSTSIIEYGIVDKLTN